VYYFEHYIREGGVAALAKVTILSASHGNWVENLREEILDVFPDAHVDILSIPDHDVDMLVIPILRTCAFPFHDALYEALDELVPLLDVSQCAKFIMLYRVNWREVEVIHASHFAKKLRRRRFERPVIRLFERSLSLRRLFAPLYPN